MVDSVEPALHDTSGMAGQKDPELALVNEWRYEIMNAASSVHPFELLDANDNVHLSQYTDPSGESDSDVGWVEDGDIVRFTVSGAPFEAIDAYQCAIHLSMTGAVDVTSDL